MENFKFNLKKLKISSIDKLFGIYRVLHLENIRFELKNENNAVAILGPSGIGKTSIFKSMFSTYINDWRTQKEFEFKCEHVFKEKIINESIIIEGKERVNFGFATQVPYFFHRKTVAANVFAPLKWKKIKKDNKFKSDYLKIWEFDKLNITDAKMITLSGGQRQVVNLARTFVLNPEVAIIDECFSSMDKSLAMRYIDIIKLHFPNSIFILTSHRVSDIEYFGADKIKLCSVLSPGGFPIVTMEAKKDEK